MKYEKLKSYCESILIEVKKIMEFQYSVIKLFIPEFDISFED